MDGSTSTQPGAGAPNYHAYLIRLWREDERAAWRGELVSPHTGEQRLFATVEQLLTFLSDQVAHEATAEQDDGGRRSN